MSQLTELVTDVRALDRALTAAEDAAKMDTETAAAVKRIQKQAVHDPIDVGSATLVLVLAVVFVGGLVLFLIP